LCESQAKALPPARVGGQLDLVDQAVLRRLPQGQAEPVCGTADEDAVAVDPATPDEGDIIEDDHPVDCGDELPVADVGHEVGLHYRQSHATFLGREVPVLGLMLRLVRPDLAR
jgi:hypothetical protein